MCEVVGMVMETSGTSADYLTLRFCEMAVGLGAELAPWGQTELAFMQSALVGANWFPVSAEDGPTTLANQLETELDTLGFVTYWDGGFSILKPCDDATCDMRDANDMFGSDENV